MEKDKKESVFKIQPENMSRIVKWAFALPLAYVGYLVVGLLIPNISGFWAPVSSFIRYVLLIGCILLVSDKFLKFPINQFISETSRFRYSFFLKGFFVMLVSLLVTSLLLFILDKKSFTYTFGGVESVKLWLIQIPMLIAASLCEELIFRSYISHFLSNGLSTSKKAIVIYSFASGLLFCIAHFSNPEAKGPLAYWALGFYFIFGLVLMLLTFKTRGIEYSFGIHLANNFFCLVILSYDNSVLQNGAVFTHAGLTGPLLIVQAVICLLVCNLAFPSFLFDRTKGVSKRNDPK